MRSRKKFLSALAGLSLLGIPLGSMAAVQFNLPSTWLQPSWQSPRQYSPLILAQQDDQHEWWHHHHRHGFDPDDYNWVVGIVISMRPDGSAVRPQDGLWIAAVRT